MGYNQYQNSGGKWGQNVQMREICHLYADFVKFDLIWIHLKLFLGKTGGKKIFWEQSPAHAPMAPSMCKRDLQDMFLFQLHPLGLTGRSIFDFYPKRQVLFVLIVLKYYLQIYCA